MAEWPDKRDPDDRGSGRRYGPRATPSGPPSPQPARPAPTAAHRRTRPAPPRTSGHTAGRIAVATVSALVLLLTGAAWRTLDTLTSNLATTEALAGSGAKDGATDILLVGMDSRVDAQGKPLTAQEQQMLRAGDVASTNTDTIIVLRVPNNGSSATAISIPRDSWVKGPEGMTKINGVYGEAKDAENQRLVAAKTDPTSAERQSTEAGRTALVNTVQDLTGLTVDHYAEIGLLGFVLMTDAVGGVQVCLKAPVQDSFSGADFPAGEQTLSGPDALSFVRQRHGLPRGDLDRIVRQQAFMASLARKVLTAGTLANPGRVSDLSTALQRSVVIDSGWNIVGFATQLQGLAGGAVHFETIPVANPDATNDAGQSIVALDPTVVHQFIASLVQPAGPSTTPPPPSPSGPDPATITVNVSNATTTGGLAAQVSGALTKAGYAPGAVSTSPTGKQQDSVVRAARADDPGAAKVAKELGALPVRADTSVVSGTVDVVLGSSYAGPGSSNGASTTASSTPAASTPAAPPITAGDGVPCIN